MGDPITIQVKQSDIIRVSVADAVPRIQIKVSPVVPVVPLITIKVEQAPIVKIEVKPPQLFTVKVSQTGARGPAGAPGATPQVEYLETPTGVINGSNATFTTLHDFVPETVEVFINGLAQIRGEGFITTGTTVIVLSVSPDIGDTLFVNYQRS